MLVWDSTLEVIRLIHARNRGRNGEKGCACGLKCHVDVVRGPL